MSAATHCQGCGVELPPPAPKGTRRKWCSRRCRVQTLYSTPCIDCGAPTSGSDGYGAHKRCRACNRRPIRWTPEEVVRALRNWAEALGRPPTAREAHLAGAAVQCSTVIKRFGSWNAGMTAAGFTPRGQGERIAYHKARP